MNIYIYILFLLHLISKIKCSSHNHAVTELEILILAAADESCFQNSNNCVPKKDSDNKYVQLKIDEKKKDSNDNSNSNPPEYVYANIFDAIPALRRTDHTDSQNYFSKVLFPTAINIFLNKYNLNQDDFPDINYNNESYDEFVTKVNNEINKQDVIRHLFPLDNKLSISLYNDDINNILYLYPIEKKINKK